MQKTEPLYISIRKYLLEIIEKNKEIPNFKLPSENQLALKFNASRITAKNAILSLEEDGLVYRKQGKGTFITPTAARLPLGNEKVKLSTVGLIVPGVQGSFMGKIIEGVGAFLKEHHLSLNILVTNCDQKQEELMIQHALTNGCKGLMIFPVDDNVYNKEILKLSLNHFPVVLIDRYLPGLNLSYVACDHYEAAYNSVKYLMAQGHEHIGFISQRREAASSVTERIKGYEQAMLEGNRRDLGDWLLECEPLDSDFEEAIECYLKSHPELTALITTSTGYGTELVQRLEEMGKRIPEDMTLMFFDNEFEAYIQMLAFRPIIIDQNPYEIGYTAAKVLYKLLYKNPKPKKVLLKEKIIEVK